LKPQKIPHHVAFALTLDQDNILNLGAFVSFFPEGTCTKKDKEISFSNFPHLFQFSKFGFIFLTFQFVLNFFVFFAS